MNACTRLKPIAHAAFVVAKPIALTAILLASLVQTPAYANEPPTTDSVLHGPNRPSMSQVAAISDQLRIDELQAATDKVEAPSKTAKNGHILDFDGWFKILADQAPALIASAEYAFPGATYAFIGRDSQALADAFEAFYESIGQHKRVVRLGLSKASFAGGTSPDTLVDFLESNGFNLNTVGESNPFILIDTVSKGGGRQGRILLDAVYTEFARRGGSPADLVKRFNMIGLVVSTYGGNIVPIEEAPRLLNEEVARYVANPRRPANGYGANHTLLNFVDKSNRNFNEAGYEHFTGAWHGSYGPMEVNPDGKTLATPGQQSVVEMRKAILLFQKKILDAVSSTTFLRKVMAEADQLGYRFSKSRPHVVPFEVKLSPQYPRSKKEFEALIAYNDAHEDVNQVDRYETALNQNVDALPPAAANVKTSINATQLSQIYESYLDRVADNNMPTLAYLRSLCYALRKNVILPEDVQAALMPVFEHARVSTQIIKGTRGVFKMAKIDPNKFFSTGLAKGGWMEKKLGARTFRNIAMAFGEFVPDCANVFDVGGIL